MKKYRIAIVGFAHMHLSMLMKAFNRLPGGVDWIGCADVMPYAPDPADRQSVRIKAAAQTLDLPRVYADYHDLIGLQPDIAIVCTDNRSHGDVVCTLLQHNIHTIVEKPMAFDLADGLRMVRAEAASQATLVINWPVVWQPSFHLAQSLTRQGIVGEPLRFQYRNPESLGPFSHGGWQPSPEDLKKQWWYQAERGGGAMLDYCGYGCLLAQWFLQQPGKSAYGLKANMLSPFAEVEDYSTMTVRYDRALAIFEGSWATVSFGSVPTGPVIYGSEGTLVCHRYDQTVKIFQKLHGGMTAVHEAQPLPADRADIALEMDHHIRTGEPVYEALGSALNLQAMAVLDAGIRSAASQKPEPVASVDQMIGKTEGSEGNDQ